MARTTPVNAGYNIINGAGTGSNGSRIDVWIEYKEISVNEAGNYSIINAYFYAALRDGQSSSTHGTSGLYSGFGINKGSGLPLQATGTAYNDAYDFRTTTPILLGYFDGTTIYHDADGTKTISFGADFTTSSTYISGGNASGSVVLSSIPRGPHAKVSGAWKSTQAFAKVNGVWKQAIAYTKVGGVWKQGT